VSIERRIVAAVEPALTRAVPVAVVVYFMARRRYVLARGWVADQAGRWVR